MRGVEDVDVEGLHTVNSLVEVVSSDDPNYPAGTSRTVPVTIQDNDSRIEATVTRSTVTEDGTDSLIFDFARTGGVDVAISVPFTVAGTADYLDDYTQVGASSFDSVSGEVAFAAGQTSQRIEIVPAADMIYEADETVALEFAGTITSFYQVAPPLLIEGLIRNDDPDDDPPPPPPTTVSELLLNGELFGDGAVTDLRATPDGQSVVYVADENGDGNEQLYIAPVDGGRVTELTNFANGMDIHDVKISGDSSYAVFQADNNGAVQLYSVATDGHGTVVRLNGDLDVGVPELGSPFRGTGQDVYIFELTPDGQHVVYLADETVDDRTDIYSSPITGGGAVRLTGNMIESGDVEYNLSNPPFHQQWFVISPDSQTVVFRADAIVDERLDLFSVPRTGGSRVRLNAALSDVEDVLYFEVTPDSDAAVFTERTGLASASTRRLLMVPLSGGSPLELDNQVGANRFSVSPDGSRILFTRRKPQPNIVNDNDVATVTIPGGVVTNLTAGLPTHDHVHDFPNLSEKRSPFSTDGQFAFVEDSYNEDGNGRGRVFDFVTGAISTVEVGPVSGGDWFLSAGSNGVLFTAAGDYVVHRSLELDQSGSVNLQSLYVSPTTGGTSTLLDRFPNGRGLTIGYGVQSAVRIGPDSDTVVYHANPDGPPELFHTTISDEATIRLTPGRTVTEDRGYWSTFGYEPKSWILSKDGARVLYLSDGNLFSVVADGSGAQYDFGDAPETYGTRVSSDGARHMVIGPGLGPLRDAEVTGNVSHDANGDDNSDKDDEDGIEFVQMYVGQKDAKFYADIRNADTEAKLFAWFDVNQNNTFDPDERLVDGVSVTTGMTEIGFNIPSSAIPGTTFARFRISSDEDLSATGPASDGEVEDYAVTIINRASVSGAVYEDVNGNGQRDVGEPGMCNVLVYVDLNNNDTHDDGNAEPYAHTLCDESGEYVIHGVPTGDQTVRQVPSPGFVQMFPGNDDPIVVPVPATGNVSDVVFANVVLGSIHGYKFEDVDGNASDDSDPRLSGITISLTGDSNGDGVVDVLHATTNVAGEYSFEGVFPGAYTVSETVPLGWLPTTPASISIILESRQALVAFTGQAPVSLPQVEVVIGDDNSDGAPDLAFGNQSVSVVVDNNDPDFSVVGSWPLVENKPQVWERDFLHNSAGLGQDRAIWTFDPLVPGQYRVSVSYRAFANRASNAPYTIFDGSAELTTILVDQRVAAESRPDGGIHFHDIGTFNIASGRIVVELTDLADGLVIADSVRIERLGDLVAGPEIQVKVNDAEVVHQTGVHDFGTVEDDEAVSQIFTVTNLGTSELDLSDGIHVPSGFTLINGFDKTELMPFETATFEIGIDVSMLGERRGQVTFGNNDTDENPFAFGVHAIVERDSGEAIIDNGDSGYGTTGSWTSINGNLKGHLDDFEYANSGTGANTARWSFEVAPGRYQVAATWRPHTNRSREAPYTIFNGSMPILTVAVDQTVVPAGVDVQDEESPFALLGVFDIPGAALSVTLADETTGVVIADAIHIKRVGSIPTGPEIGVFDSGNDVADDAGIVDFGDVEIGEPAIKRITVFNFGATDLNLTTPAPQSTASVTATSFGSTTLAPNTSTTFDVQIDTSTHGPVSGTVSFGNNDDDENPFNFAVRANVVPGSSVQVIDNSSAIGFSQTGSWIDVARNGYNGEFDYAFGSSVANSVSTWTFDTTGSGPGLYRVSVHWRHHTNRAGNARFALNDESSTTVTLNQRAKPDISNGISEQGTVFEDLGIFTMPGNTITITLDNLADGIVVADAIRIERIGDLPG